MPRVTCDETACGVELKIDSHPASLAPVRRAVEALGLRCGFDAAAVADIGLCVNEAVANVMRHAYAGATDRPIVVRAECDETGMRLTIRDWGSGVDPSCLPCKEPDPLRPGGLGLICLNKMMDECVYARQADGMVLSMLRKRAGGEGTSPKSETRMTKE